MREISKETNSYYTPQEYKRLTEVLGFKWSNRFSGMYDNGLYKYEGGVAYDIDARQNGLKFYMYVPTLFGRKEVIKDKLSLEEMEKLMKVGFLDSLSLFAMKFNAMIVGVLFLVFVAFASPFMKVEKSRVKTLVEKFRDLFRFNYHFLMDALPYIWMFNLFMLGVVLGRIALS